MSAGSAVNDVRVVVEEAAENSATIHLSSGQERGSVLEVGVEEGQADVVGLPYQPNPLLNVDT